MKLKPADKPGLAAVESATATESSPEKGLHPAGVAALAPKLKRLLVPVDFSDCSMRALDYALALGEACQARLILLHVVEPAAYPQSALALVPSLEETNQTLLEAGRERLAALCRKRLGHRMQTETLVRMGHPHSEIPDTAKAMGADLLIVGARGHTGLKHALLGSTAERVVRQAPCPVLTVR